MSWAWLDEQMAQYKKALRNEVKLADEHCNKLATAISTDIRFLPPEIKKEIEEASPVALQDRLSVSASGSIG